MQKIKIGIIGSAGYTGGELIRLLLNHPQAEIVYAHSNSQKGKYLHDVHRDLLGDTDLKFSGSISENIDVMFLCVGHSAAKKYLEENPVAEHIKIIDLSHDFRNEPDFEPLGQTARTFVYGLPEMNKEAIKSAHNIANPGCFATGIQLALLPLAASGKLNNELNITAVTGSTGAGQAPSATTHFSWRNNNLSVYKAFQHQHLKEINRSLKTLQSGFEQPINLIPYRGDFSRGIIVSAYTKCKLSLEEVRELYAGFYKDQPFTHLSESNIDLKQVVNTSKCLLYLEKHEDQLLIISITDNLLKGASGQAVQNMNLMFGLEETAGLKLKAQVF